MISTTDSEYVNRHSLSLHMAKLFESSVGDAFDIYRENVEKHRLNHLISNAYFLLKIPIFISINAYF